MTPTIGTTAVMDLTPADLNGLVEELRASHAIYSPLFQRCDLPLQREWTTNTCTARCWTCPARRSNL